MPRAATNDHETFLYDAWYVAGWSTDLKSGERIGRDRKSVV